MLNVRAYMQSRNAENFRRQALQGIPKIQRQVFWNYDGCRDAWCNSRRWEFYKYEHVLTTVQRLQ